MLSRTAAAYEADTIARLLDGGYLDIFTGPKPAAPEGLERGDRLASLRFDRPSAAASSDGSLTFYALESEIMASGSGEAGHFRAYAADHRTVILDGNVGTDGPLLMPNSFIRAGDRVQLRDATLEIVRS